MVHGRLDRTGQYYEQEEAWEVFQWGVGTARPFSVRSLQESSLNSGPKSHLTPELTQVGLNISLGGGNACRPLTNGPDFQQLSSHFLLPSIPACEMTATVSFPVPPPPLSDVPDTGLGLGYCFITVRYH